jgi:HK97 family phage portal protein
MQLISLGLTVPEKRSNPLDNPSVSLSSIDGWTWLGDGGRGTEAGEVINDVTALKISTVFACVRVLSESVASLPVRLLRITPQGRVQEVTDPLYTLLAVAPNPETTSFVYWETVAFHLSLTGNSYSEIERAKDDTPIALWPLNPRLTRAIRVNGDLKYETQDGEAGGNKRIIDAANMLHVPLMSFDGIVGLSPIMQAARALGLAAASEKFGSRFFGNNATPQLALLSKQKVKPEDKTKMRMDWESLQSNANQHRVAVLDQDLDIKQLSITPEEAQFLETRVHQRSEIAALFRVPTHLVGDTSKLANASVEGQNLSFIVDTLRPILSRIEAEIVKKLLPHEVGKAATLTVAFDLSERQRGDTAAQVSLIACGRQWGVLSANDGRRILGLPAGGVEDDELMVPVNMMSPARLNNPPKSDPAETVVQDA